ncbi:MAG: HD domain-containing protein [Candidatus Liptonbacteria bacterium]|nr:HD domain-containing protein [Candidatus Liptonbacteria bacterium]
MKVAIPKEVKEIAKALAKAGFEAHLVGGCVRDLLLEREPKDWDIATNATPKEVQRLFEDSVYENSFGTVGIKTRSENLKLAVVEVTTYRVEGKYTDKRHPDEVRFAKTVEEDLSRRDFTVNALALNAADGLEGEIIDPFDGTKDLAKKVLRTVGKPEERFDEDALRLMRAVRFAVELDFAIEAKTRKAIEKHAGLLEMIAKERIRDEFTKILEAKEAARGVLLLEELGLLKFVLPELREGIGVAQNKHHIYTVFEHHIKSLDYAAKQGYSLPVRLASLLHDLGKPKTKAGEGANSTFHGHEMVGAKMAARALERLRYSKEFIEEVVHLIRYHMFYYNVGEVSPAGVRRFLVRVGPETVPDLIKLREADRIGSGVPKAIPYKLRHFLFMIDKVKRDPVSPKMLKVKGDDVMRILSTNPSPRIGWILGILLEEVLEDPKRNTKEYLTQRVRELGTHSDEELKEFAKEAQETKVEFEGGVEKELKRRYHVE